MGKGKYVILTIIENTRILHGCEVRTENSVPRVTDWHHEAMPKERNFLSVPNTRSILFLAYLSISNVLF